MCDKSYKNNKGLVDKDNRVLKLGIKYWEEWGKRIPEHRGC